VTKGELDSLRFNLNGIGSKVPANGNSAFSLTRGEKDFSRSNSPGRTIFASNYECSERRDTIMKMNNFFQHGYIARNLDTAIATFKNLHGVENFLILDISNEVKTKWGNGPQYVRVALGWVDDLQIELIEPNGGMIDLYTENLPDGDIPHFHHIGMRIFDWESFRAEVTAQGWPVVCEADVPGCSYIYIDAREQLGHYIEYMWMSDELWTMTGGK